MSETNSKMDFNQKTEEAERLFSRRPRFITAGILLVLLSGVSLFAWHSFSQTVSGEGNHWGLLFGWFSAVAVLFLLGSLLWRETWLKGLAIGVAFAPSFIWITSMGHVVAVGVGALLSYLALWAITGDMESRTRIQPYRILHHSSTWFVVGLSVVIASQYYALSENLRWEQLIPKFDVTEGAGAWTMRLLGQFYDPARELQNKETTVDMFLLEVQKREASGHPLLGELPLDTLDQLALGDRQALQMIVLTRQRQELSRILGREVDGEEKMSELISEVFHKKTLALMKESEVVPKGVPLIPFVLSVALFLTVYPIGALLVPLWALVVMFLFYFIKRYHGFEIRTVTMDREEIV